ncbi:MAG: CBS domain-containing protein [Candidatus Latescibacterota bacterium]|jgi:CBS domain-containing protein
MTIQDILDSKGSRVITIAPQHTLSVALSALVENKVGALLIRGEQGQLAGIITERDIMRAVYQGKNLQKTRVDSIMTRNIVMGTPNQDIEYVMTEMTEGRFRHMPVVENDQLLGIISIGDLVKAKLQHTEEQVSQYQEYVALSWHAS